MSIRSNFLGSLLTVSSFVWVGAAVAGPPDSDGFLTNWPGNIKPEYNSTALPGAPPPSIASDIAAVASQSSMCPGIKTALSSLVPGANFDSNSCKIPAPPELRGKIIAPNTLGIKIIINGVSFSFDTQGATINVSGDIEVDTAINFATSISGDVKKTAQAYTTLPMTIVMPTVTPSNVKLSTKNVLANLINDLEGLLGGKTLQKLGDTIASQGGQFGGFLPNQLSNAVSKTNGLLHDAAKSIGDGIRTGVIQQPPDPNANNFFLLAVTIDAQQNLVVNFQRNGTSPPPPESCFAESLDYADVTVKCYKQTAQGIVFDTVDIMYLQRLNPAASTASVQIWDVVDDGVSNSWDAPVPRLSVPYFEDTTFQTWPQPPATATYQVCSRNDWGQVCGPDMPVTLGRKVRPHIVGGPPPCGPNSHPFQPCKALKTSVPDVGAFAPPQPTK
jgi:hypothetical protein